jgi:peptidoglycan hydrolase CwlO-like protein
MKTIFAAFTIALLMAGTTVKANALGNMVKLNKHKFTQGTKQAADWETFKKEQQEKIKNNDAHIAQLRREKNGDKANDEAYDKQIEKLQESNTELRKRIDTYRYTNQSSWEEFKRKFNHDMDELGKALKDLFRDNSK